MPQVVKRIPSQIKYSGIALPLNYKSDMYITLSEKVKSKYGSKYLNVPFESIKDTCYQLIDSPLFCSKDLKVHDRKSVGIIKSIALDKTCIKIHGEIFIHEAEHLLTSKSYPNDLGLSVDFCNVMVEDYNSDVWKVTSTSFRGVSILTKRFCAFQGTNMEIYIL